jgi:sulfite reductase alpha subunit-like flavoprotein
VPEPRGAAHAGRPAWVPVSVTRRETSESHWQQVQHIELDTAAVRGELEYEPGNVATVWPSISHDKAKEFLARVGVDPGGFLPHALDSKRHE